jgi:Tol biopolymer transport system component
MLFENRYVFVVGLIAVAFFSGCIKQDHSVVKGSPGQVPTAWIPIGNEREIVVDDETGSEIVYLTNGSSIDTIFHYHHSTWGEINGRSYVFLESSRPRPEKAGESAEGERQILAADVENGDLYYLTTIEYLDEKFEPRISAETDPLTWKTQVSTPIQYFAFYNETAKTLFFFDKQRTRLFAYNVMSGERKMIRRMEGVPRELSHYADDQEIRLMYPVIRNGHSIEVLDLDRNLNVLQVRHIRKVPPGTSINHVEMQPGNPDRFFYLQHKGSGLPHPGSRRLFIATIDSSPSQDICIWDSMSGRNGDPSPYEFALIDHMVWGASGARIYWDDNKLGLWSYDLKTGAYKLEARIEPMIGVHNQLSPDERFWVYDFREKEVFNSPMDGCTVKVSNWKGSIWLYDRQAEKNRKLANIIWAHPQPRHAHPQFSPDGREIAFVAGAGERRVNTRIAVITFDDEQEVHED